MEQNEKKTVRIGIVGTNFVSDWMAEAIQTVEGTDVTAVYSRKEETGNAFAEKHGIGRVFTSYEDFVSSDCIDAVYIASPNFAHAKQAVTALSHGKHVLCEKVIATNTRELEEMKAAAFANKCVLLEAMRPAFDPCMQIVKEQLPRLGKIRRAAFDFCQYSSRYDRFKKGEILNAFDPTLSNAAVMDIGVYIIHICAMLFGMPKRISALSTMLENGFEGAGHAVLDYGDMKAELSYAKIMDSVTPNIIMGENGSLTFGKISQPGNIRVILRGKEPEEIPFTPDENNMIHEVGVFADLVRAGQ
ncbi:MAG: Gfo/Idh/MocA family oxidoreductase, partial [Clostridia bacterium]|nr:Gfo/Idh/MocA family oxidoreductase [Clostridia bacterium]